MLACLQEGKNTVFALGPSLATPTAPAHQSIVPPPSLSLLQDQATPAPGLFVPFLQATEVFFPHHLSPLAPSQVKPGTASLILYSLVGHNVCLTVSFAHCTNE